VQGDDEATDQALAWITHLHSGNATDADRRAYRQWRSQSEANEAAAARAESLWGLVGTARPGAERRGAAGRPLLRAAGLAALVAVAGSVLWAFLAGPLVPADHRTAAGEIRSVTLADGSRLVLDGATAVDVALGEGLRRVDLRRGRVHAVVEADPARPFRVVAGPIAAEAVGTAYSVAVAGGETLVVVEDGSVRVDGTGPAGRGSLRLEAGQSVAVGGGGPEVAEVSVEDAAAWRDGLLVFHDAPLARVVGTLRNHVGRPVLVIGHEASSLRVTAVLDATAPDDALEVIESMLPVSIHRWPGLVLIRPGPAPPAPAS